MECEINTEYPSDPKELQRRLIEAENNVKKCAEIGQNLLAENNELKSHLDDMRKSFDRKVEELEQEKYSLQNKYDQKVSSESWCLEEINSLKQQLKVKDTQAKDDFENEAAKLNKQIDDLKDDLDQAQSVESQLKLKVSELEELIKSQVQQVETKTNQSFDKGEELSQLYEELELLRQEITEMKTQMIEKRSEVQVLTTENEHLRGRLIGRDEELDDIRCQFSSVNKALEEARVEKLDLKCQLDALRMESSNHNKKGNSIFSELDDRRIDAEKKLISMQVKLQSLQEKYDVEKQLSQKLKRRISQLLMEASSGRVDEEYVTNLERNLNTARQEVKTLMEQNKQGNNIVSRNDVEVPNTGEARQHTSSKEYEEFLKVLLKEREEEKTKLSEELRLKTGQLFDEKSKSLSLESQVKVLEAEKQKLYSKNIKLVLRIEELQLKYEPDAVKKSGLLTVKRSEKIPLDDPEDIQIKETCRHGFSENNSSKVSSNVIDNPQESTEVFEKENDKTRSVNLLDCLKRKKSVHISDDIEEHEIENETLNEGQDGVDSNPPQKGRRVTSVKYVKTENVNKDPNECKTQ